MPELHRIHADDANQRLDRYLRKILPVATLAHVFKLIRTGRVRLNGERAKPSMRVHAGDEVQLSVNPELLSGRGSERASDASHAAELRILYEDEHVLAVDKPAGLPVHPGSGVTDHLIGRVHARFGIGGARTFRPALAHRLDRETSGVVLVGRSAAALRGLTSMLRDGAVKKRYLAILDGIPAQSRGRIDLPLVRREGVRAKVSAGRGPASKNALTEFRVVARASAAALVEVRLHTGRTHQIRAHFAALGTPLYGDRRYGAAAGTRLFLHASELSLQHPITGESLRISAKLPSAFQKALRRLGLPEARRSE